MQLIVFCTSILYKIFRNNTINPLALSLPLLANLDKCTQNQFFRTAISAFLLHFLSGNIYKISLP